jgi:hypothetical protein
MCLKMLLVETQERVFASLETAKEYDNLCESAFVWVPKGDGKWFVMEVAFLIKCNSKEWLDKQIKEREIYYAPTKSDISTRGRIS